MSILLLLKPFFESVILFYGGWNIYELYVGYDWLFGVEIGSLIDIVDWDLADVFIHDESVVQHDATLLSRLFDWVLHYNT